MFVFVGALIHWVFCLTANFAGSFDNVLQYIFRLAARYVIIEWVEPVDSGICSLHHIERCAGDAHIADRYTREGFVNALGKLGDIRATFEDHLDADVIRRAEAAGLARRRGGVGKGDGEAPEAAMLRPLWFSVLCRHRSGGNVNPFPPAVGWADGRTV